LETTDTTKGAEGSGAAEETKDTSTNKGLPNTDIKITGDDEGFVPTNEIPEHLIWKAKEEKKPEEKKEPAKTETKEEQTSGEESAETEDGDGGEESGDKNEEELTEEEKKQKEEDGKFSVTLKVKNSKNPEKVDELKFDLRKEEDRNKLIEYGQKGRYVETELAKVKDYGRKVGALYGNFEAAKKFVMNKFLFDVLDNKVVYQDPSQPEVRERLEEYALSMGWGDDRTEQFIAEQDKNYKATLKEVKKFEAAHTKAAETWDSMLSKFEASHPEVADVEEYSSKVLAPYLDAIASAGSVPFPEDTLEMVHYWNNREAIEKKIREDAIKEYAKNPPEVKKKGAKNLRSADGANGKEKSWLDQVHERITRNVNDEL
jgi:hypothetical protein